MKIKKPNFWDYKKPNVIAYLLWPISFILQLVNSLGHNKKKVEKIKTICVGNIYIGGTGKTPISISINKILNKLNFKTAFIKKYYSDQTDEQKILSLNGKLFCQSSREDSLNRAINDKIDVAIFDDGLQDKKISYDIAFVCFNIDCWIGNGLTLPSGPLRESLLAIKKYDAIFLNGNNEKTLELKNIINRIAPKIKIFEAAYRIINIDKFDLNKNYMVFSGIGNPNSFKKTLEKNNFKILKLLEFPDHYNYSDKDIFKIKESAKKINAQIITTKKDYVKLNKFNSENINYLEIEMQIFEEKELINFINKKL